MEKEEIEFWSQLRYSTERIYFLLFKNKEINENLEKYIGKPIYEGMIYTIEKHNKEIEEEKNICISYLKQINN